MDAAATDRSPVQIVDDAAQRVGPGRGDRRQETEPDQREGAVGDHRRRRISNASYRQQIVAALTTLGCDADPVCTVQEPAEGAIRIAAARLTNSRIDQVLFSNRVERLQTGLPRALEFRGQFFPPPALRVSHDLHSSADIFATCHSSGTGVGSQATANPVGSDAKPPVIDIDLHSPAFFARMCGARWGESRGHEAYARQGRAFRAAASLCSSIQGAPRISKGRSVPRPTLRFVVSSSPTPG